MSSQATCVWRRMDATVACSVDARVAGTQMEMSNDAILAVPGGRAGGRHQRRAVDAPVAVRGGQPGRLVGPVRRPGHGGLRAVADRGAGLAGAPDRVPLVPDRARPWLVRLGAGGPHRAAGA